jgi:hypothetical protein
MKENLQMVALVDENTVTAVVRDAVRDYLNGLDLKWYSSQLTEVHPSDAGEGNE